VTDVFQANGLATLIGSLPLADHHEALDLILEHMPEIPIWAQLPVHGREGMMVQFRFARIMSRERQTICQDSR